MIRELDMVVLTCDVPEHGLKQGDVGTAVLVHKGGGYTVEFLALNGDTVAVVTLARRQIRPVRRREVANARRLASTSVSRGAS